MGRLALEILNDIADALGYPQLTSIEGEQTKNTRKLVGMLNRVLRIMSGMQDWIGLRTEGEIITTPIYRVGAADVTKDSNVVTGVDDPETTAVDLPVWTSEMVGRAFAISGEHIIYRITAVNSSTEIELNRPYQGETGTAKAYVMAQDRYELPEDFDRPSGDWTTMLTTATDTLVGIDTDVFRLRRREHTGLSFGTPEVFTLFEVDEQGEHRLAVLDPFPQQAEILNFPYQRQHPKISQDTDKVRFQLRYDALIIDAMIYLLKRDIEDDARSDVMLIDFLREKNEGLAKKESTDRRHRLKVSQRPRMLERWKWRAGTAGGLDLHEHFDRCWCDH